MTEPAATIRNLSEGQQQALLTIFFAGSMRRQAGNFVVDGYPDVQGKTAQILIDKGLIKLIVERVRQGAARSSTRGTLYRYSIDLSDKGHWYVNTILEAQRVANECMTENFSYLTAPPTGDNFEESSEVYRDEREAEGAI